MTGNRLSGTGRILRIVVQRSSDEWVRTKFAATIRKAAAELGPEAARTMAACSPIGIAVLEGSLASYEGVRTLLGLDTGPHTSDQFDIFCEFAYFYVHMAARFAILEGLAFDQLGRVKEYLIPGVGRSAIEMFFAEWADAWKSTLIVTFMQNLSVRGGDYSNYPNPSSMAEAVAQGSLLRRLGEHVAAACGAPPDRAVADLSAGLAIDALRAMDLAGLFASVHDLL